MQTRNTQATIDTMLPTLKGRVEHMLFIKWVLANTDEEADRIMQRLIDVRFERKKCEAYALANR